jgi:hypothetical protein
VSAASNEDNKPFTRGQVIYSNTLTAIHQVAAATYYQQQLFWPLMDLPVNLMTGCSECHWLVVRYLLSEINSLSAAEL